MPTIRVSERTHKYLQSLSKSLNKPMQTILEQAVEEYRRAVLLDKLNDEYAALRADPDAWKEVLEERRLLEGTLADGLDSDERF